MAEAYPTHSREAFLAWRDAQVITLRAQGKFYEARQMGFVWPNPMPDWQGQKSVNPEWDDIRGKPVFDGKIQPNSRKRY